MPVDQLATIGTLRDRHLSLMREWRDLENDETRRARASEMRRTAVEAGRNIEAPLERDEAQGIVDYWASAIAGLPGGTYPELLTIGAYSGAQAADAGRSARETYEALRPQEAQRLARNILEDLLILGNNGVERDRPRSRQILLRNTGATDPEMFDRVLASLVESGAIIRRASESPADDIFEVADGRIAESWPALEQWLLAAKSYSVERARMMDQAQRWEDADRRRDLLLLTGGDVEKALSFKGQDDLLDDYIECSRRVRSKVRRVAVTILAVAVIVLSGTLAYAWREMSEAQKQMAEAKQQLAEARRVEQNAQATATDVSQLNYDVSERERQQIGPDSVNPADAAAAQELAALPAVRGAMWLGSSEAPQVTGLAGNRVTDFAGMVGSPGTELEFAL